MALSWCFPRPGAVRSSKSDPGLIVLVSVCTRVSLRRWRRPTADRLIVILLARGAAGRPWHHGEAAALFAGHGGRHGPRGRGGRAAGLAQYHGRVADHHAAGDHEG